MMTHRNQRLKTILNILILI